MDKIIETFSYIASPGIVLFPNGLLPYYTNDPIQKRAIEYALGRDRLLGVFQPLPEHDDAGIAAWSPEQLFQMGCIGRIATFSEVKDDSYFVLIQGLHRCQITAHPETKADALPLVEVTRAEQVSKNESQDPQHRLRFLKLLADYLHSHQITLDWNDVSTATDEALVSALTMMCPFKAHEKQAILESNSWQERFDMLTSFIELSQLENQPETILYH